MDLLPLALALLLILLTTLYLLLILFSPSPHPVHPSELLYLSALNPQTPQPLPSLADPATLGLSVVIPAYNEELRLGKMLDEAVPYLEAHHSAHAPTQAGAGDDEQVGEGEENGHVGAHDPPGGLKGYEILIVDDGSRDTTSSTALAYALAHPSIPIRLVTLQKNQGKGGAVRHGMLHSRGARILFVDADGATRFEDLKRLWKECGRLERLEVGGGARGYAAVVGSRAHLVGTEAVVKRSLIRNILMHGLHTILRTLGISSIKDTQCGFKLFSRPLSLLIFPAQHLRHWMFDVELLILCSMLRVPVSEVPVGWHEVGGSKINLVWDSLGMLRDLVVVRANYAVGRWRVPRMPRAEQVNGGMVANGGAK